MCCQVRREVKTSGRQCDQIGHRILYKIRDSQEVVLSCHYPATIGATSVSIPSLSDRSNIKINHKLVHCGSNIDITSQAAKEYIRKISIVAELKVIEHLGVIDDL